MINKQTHCGGSLVLLSQNSLISLYCVCCVAWLHLSFPQIAFGALNGFYIFFLTIINTMNNLFLLFRDSFIIHQVGKRFHQHHIVVTLKLNSNYFVFEELQKKYWIPHFCKHTELSTGLLFCITVRYNPFTSTYKYSS